MTSINYNSYYNITMSYSFNKICRGALVTIAMLLGSVSTGAVVLIIKHAGRALQLSKDSSKHATQRTIAQNITFRLSKELEKVIASKGSSTQPFTYTFVNNSDPTVTVRTYSETPTDSSALNISILSSSDDSLDLNSQTSKTSLRTRVTSRDQTRRNNVGRNARIIQDTITATSPTAASPTAAQGAGGYSLQVQKVYPAPGESKSAIYALLIQGYACDNGNASDGSCNSSSILGDHSIIVFKKRTCIDTRLAPFSNPNGDQLVIAANPGTDFYNLKCTCPSGKTIQADGTCVLTCAAGQRLYNGACQNCTSGSEWSYAGSSSCNTCNGCGTSGGGGTCDVTQGCTSCPAGKRLSGNSCVPCSAGTWAAAGANVCSSCISTGTTACNSSTGGATSCSAGYGLSGSTCTLCTAGKYSAGGASACSSCAAGTYSSVGASSCTSCAAGTYSYGGAGSCTSCAAGTYSSGGASSCTSCAAGTYSSGGANSCSSCGAATWSPSNSISCQSCGSGVATCNPTNGTIITCSDGYTLSGSICTSCAGGTYWNGSQCAPCPDNSTGCDQNTGGATGCVDTFGLSGARGAAGTVCNSCPQYCQSCTYASTCIVCYSYAYLSGGTCILCPPGADTTFSGAATNVSQCKCERTYYYGHAWQWGIPQEDGWDGSKCWKGGCWYDGPDSYWCID